MSIFEGEDLFLAYVNADQRTGMAGGKPNYSIDQAANQLIRGEPGWGGVMGAPVTVTYAFRADAPATMPNDTFGFVRFTPAQITATELALQGWSDVARITFSRVGGGTSSEVAYSNEATILFSGYTSGQDGAAGFSSYPGLTRSTSSAGDVWINGTQSGNMALNVGQPGLHILVHEIGHSIGLAHPSDYDTSDATAPTYAASASYYQDTRQYTVMSYFSEANTGGRFLGTYAAAPMLDDIAAAQRIYGANMDTRVGDTVYGFNATADRPWFVASAPSSRLVFAVWDAGGSDTFDFSGYGNGQLIDLRPGFFSDVGGLTGNVAIAWGTLIENARGGSGADTLYGNSLGNAIFAGGGADTVSGGDGANYLRGEAGNDVLFGGVDFDDINGNTGDDTAQGGAGGDWVVGGQDNDILFGETGEDIVYGNLGTDTANGGDGDDLVRGGQGDDSLTGGLGNDFLSGDRGADTISGGAGADIFNTFTGAGVDRVLDFSFAEGDRVRVEGAPFGVAAVGADVVVDLGGGDQIVLAGVSLSSLGDGWIYVV